MNITFAPHNLLQVDDARIIYRNFSGAASKFNREGDRNFSVLIDNEEVKDALISEGWNVKIRQPRDEGDTPFMHLPVKVKFNDRGPAVYLVSGTNKVRLTEETVEMLDNIDIDSVDMDISPFDWEINGKNGRTAYLRSIRVVQKVDRFADEY